jgi:PAN-like domain
MPIVDKTNQMIQILPLPGNIKFTSNSQLVSGITTSTHDATYTPNGQYIITASSYASDSTQPYNAFNENEVSGWQTDFSGNTNYNVNTNSHPQYVQNPYNEGNPSTYQGGGTTTNTWVTTVGDANQKQTYVKGEWIQIQLPYSIHLFRYSLLTPPYTESSTFPVKFMIVGSNDGNTWNYVDFRNTTTEGVPPIASHPFKLYNINTTQKYSYFRLILSEMSGKIPYVRLNQWNLWGITVNRKNNDAVAPVASYSKEDTYTTVDNNRLTGTTYTLLDSDKKPTVDECKTSCASDLSCNAFMYAGKPDPITNQPMWQCLASVDERHTPLTSNDSTGFTQSSVYVKKQIKETFVGLDRGLELNSTANSTASTMQSPDSENKKCHALKSSDLDILLYTNIAISVLAVGFFAYTFAK